MIPFWSLYIIIKIMNVWANTFLVKLLSVDSPLDM